MRVLLSGSTGFVGSALGAALTDRGDEVVPVVRRDPAPGQVGIDLEHRALDLSRLPGGELAPIDAVVHLAGAPLLGLWTARRKEAIRSSRIAVGHLLATVAAGLDPLPATFVTGSAIGYYGDTGEMEVDESAANGTGFLASLCAAWEASARPATEASVRVVALRTGIVLGPGGGVLGPQVPAFRLGLGARLGSGRQWTSWISLADEVRAILALLDDASVAGPVNLTAPNPVRNAEMTAALAHSLGRPAILGVPAPILRLGLGRQLADGMLLVSQRVRPRKLAEAGFDYIHPAIGEALAAAVPDRHRRGAR